MKRVEIKTKDKTVTVQQNDEVVFRYSARGKDNVFVDTGKVDGVVNEIYPHYITILSPRGYIRTVKHVDVMCGHAKLTEHRRGGKKAECSEHSP